MNDSSRREFFGKRRILLERQFKKGVFFGKRRILLERQFKKGVFQESKGYFLNSSSRNIIAESEGTGKS